MLPLEKLNGALVFLSLIARGKCPEVPAPAGLWIDLAGINSVLA
jgi:hypothetical protein